MSDLVSGDSESSRRSVALGLIAIIVLIGGGITIFDRWIMPPRTPDFGHPSAWDVLVDSRLVIGLIRLIAIIVALYVVISVIALIRNGRWIVGLGGATTDALDRQELQRQLQEAETEVTDLRHAYSEAIDLLMQAVGDVPDFPDDGQEAPNVS